MQIQNYQEREGMLTKPLLQVALEGLTGINGRLWKEADDSQLEGILNPFNWPKMPTIRGHFSERSGPGRIPLHVASVRKNYSRRVQQPAVVNW
jgi:hypothetical protein